MSLLLVCSGGGHLKGLHQMADRLPFSYERRTWVTFDTGLSRSLLEGEDVVWARYAAPRDIPNIARNGALAAKMLASRRWQAVMSTGSSIAVNFLPLAAARGIPSYFIESSARVIGPSMTGRILRHAPGVATYTQHAAWADRRWRFAGSIFDCFEPLPPLAGASANGAAPRRRRVVVAVGTTESYGFRRMLEALLPLLAGDDVTWQTGATDTTGLEIDARPTVPFDEMGARIAEADVVITHAGVGSALTALESGLCPVLVPRLQRYDEHVDDHQLQIADELASRGLAIRCDPDDLTPAVIAEAVSRRVGRTATPPPMNLERHPLGRAGAR